MSDKLLFEGKTYISSRRAADKCGYSQDYIGQLIRSKKITARMVGRSWFVSEDSLDDYQQAIEAEALLPQLRKPVPTPAIPRFAEIAKKITAGAASLAIVLVMAGGYYFADASDSDMGTGAKMSVKSAVESLENTGQRINDAITDTYDELVEDVMSVADSYVAAVFTVGQDLNDGFGQIANVAMVVAKSTVAIPKTVTSLYMNLIVTAGEVLSDATDVVSSIDLAKEIKSVGATISGLVGTDGETYVAATAQADAQTVKNQDANVSENVSDSFSLMENAKNTAVRFYRSVNSFFAGLFETNNEIVNEVVDTSVVSNTFTTTAKATTTNTTTNTTSVNSNTSRPTTASVPAVQAVNNYYTSSGVTPLELATELSVLRADLELKIRNAQRTAELAIGNTRSYVDRSAQNVTNTTVVQGGSSDAGSLTGATLASNVLSSSLTSLGTIANLTATNATINTLLTINGLSDGCLEISSGQVGSSGNPCGSGGGGSDSNWTYNSSLGFIRLATTTNNVAIGTTTPTATNRLSVAGNAFFTGDLTAANVTATGTINSSGAFTTSSGVNVGAHLTFTNNSSNLRFRNGSGTNYIYSPAANQLSLMANNVGVGTTSPSNMLEVAGSGYFSDNLTAASVTATGTLSGRTGVSAGVSGANTGILSTVNTNSGTTAALLLTNTSSASGAGSVMRFLSNTNVNVAEITGAASAASGASGYLAFSTRNAGSVSEAMRIIAGGNVGIGTTSPGAKLDVWGGLTVGTSSTPAFAVDTASGLITIGSSIISSTGTTNGLSMGAGGTTAIQTQGGGIVTALSLRNSTVTSGSGTQLAFRTSSVNMAEISAVVDGTTSNGYLSFGVRGSNVLAEKMRLTGAGNLGVGTTTPSNRLEVSGDTFLGGNVTATGTLRLLPLSNTVLAVDANGNVIATTTSGGGSGTVSSGLTGQVPYYAADGTTLTGTSTLFINGGSVGVGTTTPNAVLTVSGPNTSNIFAVRSDAGTNKFSVNNTVVEVSSGHTLRVGSVAANAYVDIYSETSGGLDSFIRTRTGRELNLGGDAGTQLTLVSNSTIYTASSVRFGVGTSSPSAKLAVTGTAGTADIFAVASSTQERLFTIKSTGNVGIGTTSPSNTLEVAGTSYLSGLTTIGNNLEVYVGGSTGIVNIGTPAASPGITLYSTTGGSGQRRADIRRSPSALSLLASSGTSGASPANNDGIVILNGGLVGIGTTTPSNRLDVAGAAYFGGNVTATGTLRLTPLSSTVLAVDQNGNVIATTTSGGGSGTVSSGLTGQVPYYAADGTTLTGTSTILISDGKVGIGTTSPSSILSVKGSTTTPSTTDLFTVSSSTDSGGDFKAFTVNYRGAVGIGGVTPGLTSATAALTVQGFDIANSGTAILRLNDSGGTTRFVADNGGRITATQSSSLAPINITANNSSTAVGAGNEMSFANNGTQYAGISGVIESATNGYMALSTRRAGTVTEVIRMTSQGLVGIGTSSPSARLDVWGGLTVGTSSTPAFAVDTATNNIIIGSSVISGTGSVNGLSMDSVGRTAIQTSGAVVNTVLSLRNSTVSSGSGTALAFRNATVEMAAISGVVDGNTTTGYMSFASRSSNLLNERMRLTGVGNLGIGTTSPAAKLAVHAVSGDTNEAIFTIASSTNGGAATSTLLTVLAKGLVGIGTTTPTNSLEVSGNIYGNGTLTTEGNLTVNGVARVGVSSSLLSNPDLQVNGSGGGALRLIRVDTNISNDELLGTLTFGGTDGNVASAASISGRAAEPFTGSVNGAYLVFGVTPIGSASVFEAMRLSTSGYLGIGTTTPSAKLSITGTAGSLNNLFAIASSTEAELFTVTSGGNVGIGVTAPTRALDVAGNGYFSGALTAGSSFISGGNASVGRASGGIGARNLQAFGASGASISAMRDDVTIVADELLGSYAFGGADGSVTFSAGIAGYAAESFTSSVNGSYMIFRTTAIGTSSAEERMRITDSGNVGIGTTTTPSRLNIDGALRVSSSNGAVVIGDTSGNARGANALDIQSARNSTMVASGADSIAFGQYNTSSGVQSIAVGTNNISSGYYSGTFGDGNEVTAQFAQGFGFSNDVIGDSGASFGLYNGVFSNEGAAFGNNNLVNNTGGMAFGYFNEANGYYSSAFGQENYAQATSSSAFGNGNEANNYRSVAFGDSNIVNANGASAFGSNITNSIASSTQIGPSDSAKLTILSSGNVGIGTSTPTSKLTVAGDISIDNSGVASALILGDANYGGSVSGLCSTCSEVYVQGSRAGGLEINGNNGIYFSGWGWDNHLTINGDTGYIGIGTTTPERPLHVYRSTDGPPVRFEDSNGYCEIDPTNTSWTCTSDRNLKKDINNIPSGDILSKFSQLQAVSFKWKNQESDDLRYGLIAQDVEAIFPELVTTSDNGIKSVSYGGFTPFMIEAIKALNLSIEDLKTRVASVEDRLGAVESLLGTNVSNSASTSVSATTSSSTVIAIVSDWFSSVGVAIENTVVRFVSIFADRIATKELTVGDTSNFAAAGITVLDRGTGQPACMYVENGVITSRPGECGAVTGVSNQPVNTPVVTPEPVVEPEPIVEEVEESVATSTEPVTESSIVEEAQLEPDSELEPSSESEAAVEPVSETETVPVPETETIIEPVVEPATETPTP